MYRGVLLLDSQRDNLHSVPAFGYNSIQRPVIIVSTSIYCFHPTVLVCFPDPLSLPCDNDGLFQSRGTVLGNGIWVLRYLSDCKSQRVRWAQSQSK